MDRTEARRVLSNSWVPGRRLWLPVATHAHGAVGTGGLPRRGGGRRAVPLLKHSTYYVRGLIHRLQFP